MNLKRWQKRKLAHELIALVVTLIGLIVFLRFMMNEAHLAWVALLGAAVAIMGFFAFMSIRDSKKYKKKYPDRTRK